MDRARHNAQAATAIKTAVSVTREKPTTKSAEKYSGCRMKITIVAGSDSIARAFAVSTLFAQAAP